MTVQIILQLPAGGEQKVTLPDNIEVGRLVPALVSKLALPSVAADGHALKYELAVAGQTLSEAETLGSVGIASGTKVHLSASRAEWPIAAQPPQSSSSRINSWPPALNSTPEPETIQWQDPIRIGPENHRVVQWARSRWKLLLFVGFMIWRAAVSLFPTQSEPRQLAPLVPTSTIETTASDITTVAISTPEAATIINDFVDSPVFVANHLYFLFEDELGYGLWQVDFSAEVYSPERIMTVSRLRNPTHKLIVDEGLLYFMAGDSHLLHYLIPGDDVGMSFSFPNQSVGHPPVRLQDTWLFTSLPERRAQPLVAFSDDSFTTIAQTANSAQSSLPLTRTTGITDGLTISRTTNTLRPLPVLVNPYWYRHQATLDGVNYFAGIDELGGAELWRTDGTIEGTYQVKDIRQGPLGSAPANLIAFNDFIFFAAFNDEGQVELWRSDGTEEGTIQLFDQHGERSSYPAQLHIIRDQLFYSARGADDKRVFWRIYSDSGGRDLLDSPLSLGWELDMDPFQFGANADTHTHIATSARGQSLIVRQPIEDSEISWNNFNAEAGLEAVYVSGEITLLMDSSGSFFQYRERTFTPVAELPSFAEVVNLDETGFALISPDGEVWLYSGAEIKAVRLLDLSFSLIDGS